MAVVPGNRNPPLVLKIRHESFYFWSHEAYLDGASGLAPECLDQFANCLVYRIQNPRYCPSNQ